MAEVTVAVAKATLSELLNRAEAGEEITITRRGRPVAVLNSPRAALEPRAALRARLPAMSTASSELLRQMRDDSP